MDHTVFTIGVLSLMATIIIAVFKASSVVMGKIEDSRIEMRDQIIAVNNMLIMSVKTAEARLEVMIDRVEKDLHEFKFESTANLFVGRSTFDQVMMAQTNERKEMKIEIMERLGRIDTKLDEASRAR